ATRLFQATLQAIRAEPGLDAEHRGDALAFGAGTRDAAEVETAVEVTGETADVRRSVPRRRRGFPSEEPAPEAGLAEVEVGIGDNERGDPLSGGRGGEA